MKPSARPEPATTGAMNLGKKSGGRDGSTQAGKVNPFRFRMDSESYLNQKRFYKRNDTQIREAFNFFVGAAGWGAWCSGQCR